MAAEPNPEAAHRSDPTVGLVLPGGGARAAYQVGVLKAIARDAARTGAQSVPDHRRHLGRRGIGRRAGHRSLSLAARRSNALEHVWANFHVQQVFRVDAWSMLRSGMHWVLSLVSGGVLLPPPLALFDNSPLRALLAQNIRWGGLQRSIDDGDLRALALCATSYSSASSVAFYPGRRSDDGVVAAAAHRATHRAAARSRDGESGRAVPVSAGAAGR